MINNADKANLMTLIINMGPITQELLYCRYLYGFTLAQTAVHLQLTARQTYRLYEAARAALRPYIQKDYTNFVQTLESLCESFVGIPVKEMYGLDEWGSQLEQEILEIVLRDKNGLCRAL